MRFKTPSNADTNARAGTQPSAGQRRSLDVDSGDRRKVGALLWSVQGLLALIFLFAGSMKLVLPIDEMTQQLDLPGLFLRFIGVCEVLGALGLILPGLLRIRPGLTPLAAAGLVIIMIGATTLTLAIGAGAGALVPLVVGLLAAVVAYGRWRLAPHRGPSRVAVLRPAV